MKTSDIIYDEIPWQATVWGWALNLRDEKCAAIQTPEILAHRLPKEFNKEAAYMIYVMFVFILLAVLGSSVTAYEFFFQDNGRKTNSRRNSYDENKAKRMRIIENQRKSLKSQCSAWFEDFKYFLKFFCMVKNGNKILSTASTERQIAFVQGLRCLGSAWIILLHTNMCYIFSLKDVEEAKPIFESIASQLVLNGFFAVDMFFVISGFLNAYTFSHKFRNLNGNISWVFFYCKRFIRLTPVYMILLGFYTTLFTYMGTGITWPAYNTNPVCKKDWWWYLLYINNFEESKKQCMAVYWHLAADMQYYLISPLFLISLKRWPRFGHALVFACICGSYAASFMLTYQYSLTDGISRFVFHLADSRNYMIQYWKYFDVIHIKPYTRISQYLAGLTLGHYLYEKRISKKVIRNSKITLFCGHIATACFMWIYLFSLHKRKEILFETALYNGTKYLFSSCSLTWIMYVCFTGQAEFLNIFLSWKALLPFARLSYCAYLIHPILLTKLVFEAEYFMDFNLKSLMLMYLYTCACTYIVSFIASMFFEMPVLNLLDWLDKKKMEKISSLTNSNCKTLTQNVSDIYKIS